MRLNPKYVTDQKFWITPLLHRKGRSNMLRLVTFPYSNFPKRERVNFPIVVEHIDDMAESDYEGQGLPYVTKNRNDIYLQYFNERLL